MAALSGMLALLVLGGLLAWSIPAGARAGTTASARLARPAVEAGAVLGSSSSSEALPSLSIGAATLPPQSATATSTPTPTPTPTPSSSLSSSGAATTGGDSGGGRDAIETDLILIMVGSGVVVLLSILGLWITRDVRRRRLRAH